jgi:hypothetical protein
VLGAFRSICAFIAALFAPVFRAADKVWWLRPVLVFAAGWAFAWWFFHTKVPLSPGNVPDFTVFHAAATPGPIYDAHWLTNLQGAAILRPFAYPPTFLFVCKPLGLVPLETAYCLWNALCWVAYVEATARLIRRLPWLVLFSPLLALTTVLGQTAAPIAALLIFGMTLLHRPLLAGVLFGIAFAIKPQVMLLLPVALMMSGHWRTLVAMGTSGLALCLASLVWGPQLWPQWIGSLAEFRAINEAIGVWKMTVPMPWTPLAAMGLLPALWATRHADTPSRLIVIIAGSLMISPHAQSYETAMLVPPALALLFTLQWRSLIAIPMLYIRFVQPWGLALYVFLTVAGALKPGPSLLPRKGPS